MHSNQEQTILSTSSLTPQYISKNLGAPLHTSNSSEHLYDSLSGTPPLSAVSERPSTLQYPSKSPRSNLPGNFHWQRGPITQSENVRTSFFPILLCKWTPKSAHHWDPIITHPFPTVLRPLPIITPTKLYIPSIVALNSCLTSQLVAPPPQLQSPPRAQLQYPTLT